MILRLSVCLLVLSFPLSLQTFTMGNEERKNTSSILGGEEGQRATSSGVPVERTLGVGVPDASTRGRS